MAKLTNPLPPYDGYSERNGNVSVTFYDNKVDISVADAWGEDMDYKVVLMKIS